MLFWIHLNFTLIPPIILQKFYLQYSIWPSVMIPDGIWLRIDLKSCNECIWSLVDSTGLNFVPLIVVLHLASPEVQEVCYQKIQRFYYQSIGSYVVLLNPSLGFSLSEDWPYHIHQSSFIFPCPLSFEFFIRRLTFLYQLNELFILN